MVLHSGLGNQMFQYAAARALAIKGGFELLIDPINGFRDDPFERRYELGAFGLAAACLPEAQCRRPPLRVRLAFRATRELEILAMRRWGRYHLPLLQKASLQCAGAVFGYWQSPRYFADTGAALREEYRLKERPSSEILAIRERLGGGESVGVHVRLMHGHSASGALVSGASSEPRRREASLAYYRKAIAWIQSRVTNPSWLVVTDSDQFEPEWLELPRATPILRGDPQRSPAEDLCLFSQAKHKVIGPSTFGWWGCWLSGPGGYVCAPRAFQPNGSLRDPRGIYPAEWTVL